MHALATGRLGLVLLVTSLAACTDAAAPAAPPPLPAPVAPARAPAPAPAVSLLSITVEGDRWIVREGDRHASMAPLGEPAQLEATRFSLTPDGTEPVLLVQGSRGSAMVRLTESEPPEVEELFRVGGGQSQSGSLFRSGGIHAYRFVDLGGEGRRQLYAYTHWGDDTGSHVEITKVPWDGRRFAGRERGGRRAPRHASPRIDGPRSPMGRAVLDAIPEADANIVWGLSALGASRLEVPGASLPPSADSFASLFSSRASLSVGEHLTGLVREAPAPGARRTRQHVVVLRREGEGYRAATFDLGFVEPPVEHEHPPCPPGFRDRGGIESFEWTAHGPDRTLVVRHHPEPTRLAVRLLHWDGETLRSHGDPFDLEVCGETPKRLRLELHEGEEGPRVLLE